MNHKRVTIYDVAKEAGVSPGTVSRHINGVGIARGDTDSRIEAAIKKLNYIPNRNARALKSNKTNLICLAFPESDNPFFFDMIARVEMEVKRHGYMLMIYHTHGQPEEELRILELTHENIFDGLILIDFHFTPEHFEAFRQVECPLVINGLSKAPYDPSLPVNFDYVGIDVEHAMYRAAEHMIHKGHRQIALVAGDTNLNVFKERCNGYCRALQEHGMIPEDSCIITGNYDEEAGYQAGYRIGNMRPTPTAVCAVSDVMAIGCMRALQEQNLRIPEDIAIISLDNIAMDKALTPKLSSANMMQQEMGACAVELILSRISGDTSPAKRVIYRPEIIERESSMFHILPK